jgi:regulatory protein
VDQTAYKSGLAAAIRLLSRRDHSRAELTGKLSRRGYDPAVTDAVVAECLRLDYLNDQTYSLRQTLALRRRGYGAKRIRRALYAKGLDADMISAAIEKHCGDQNQLEDCRRVLTKKITRSLRPHGNGQEHLFRFLLQRGYSVDIIRQVLSEVSVVE